MSGHRPSKKRCCVQTQATQSTQVKFSGPVQGQGLDLGTGTELEFYCELFTLVPSEKGVISVGTNRAHMNRHTRK